MSESVCPRTAHIEDELSAADDEQSMQELVAHLDACPVCRRQAQSGVLGAELADDLHWAQAVRAESAVDVNAPVSRLNAVLTDYEIVREIGRGGMGIVFEARQRKLNRLVALKVLPALLGAVRPDAVARFRREAELAASLKHSNIIAVYDFGEVDGTLFYAMELIEGRTLREVLREIEETGAVEIVVGSSASTVTKRQGDTETRRQGDKETTNRAVTSVRVRRRFRRTLRTPHSALRTRPRPTIAGWPSGSPTWRTPCTTRTRRA